MHYWNNLSGWGSNSMMNNWQMFWWPAFWWPGLFLGLLAWSLVWKGMALWKSARYAHKVWFVVLLVTNTVGILDILYLYVFSKKSKPVEK